MNLQLISRLKYLSISFLIGIFLTACGDGFTSQNASFNSEENQGSDSEQIALFFSKPVSDGNNPEIQLVNALDHAISTIDMAIYDLDLKSISESLIEAHKQGILIRVITDSDNLNKNEFIRLTTSGISVRGDKRSSLMHNKFTVIDNKEVWTGSMNYTFNGAHRNRNNLIRLVSVQAANNYTEEFSQLWVGIHSQVNATNNYFSINSIPVDIHFSPDDNFRSNRLIPLLQQAQQSVHMLAFSFTSQDIAKQLYNLKQQGVEVKVVIDNSQSGQSSSQYDDLLAKNMDIRVDGQAYKLHHKVIIIDGHIIISGSYNFSENAESRNDENSVVIDSSAMGRRYEAEFLDIYEHAISKPAQRHYDDGFESRF